MKNNIKIGKIGEDLACKHIIKLGWKILGRNYHERSDEIDIIAQSDDKTLVFCEVKTLTMRQGYLSSGLVPEDNLSAFKLKKISRACQIFAGKHPELIHLEKGWRIDLFAVELQESGVLKNMRHYENI